MSEKGDSDEDLPQLSAETFAALQEFYREEEEREHNINLLIDQKDVTLKEDWQLSQFWYNQDTIDSLVKLTLKSVGDNAKIALISCPSLYKTMKKVGKGCEITLYEYDKRFSAYGADYLFYDYKSPLSIPRDKSDYYDIVLADPPFLSDECLTKTALTIRFLTKSKIVLCTGAVMEDLLKRLLDLRKTSFEPKHENNLANEFCCFTNFDLDSLL
ncbi:EEF1A lysine methyltransferase 1 [Diabrotica undecimpunctata]|uniref:EEF1A lysine methyltransferase 1 n=1 Tax=Diabrotica undecimpunctata TaxID=50387 RepID=UPI003B63217D